MADPRLRSADHWSHTPRRAAAGTQCGRLCIGRRKINFSNVFGGQHVGIREIADGIWLVSFMDFDLGIFYEKENRVEPANDSPLVPKVLPM